MEELSKAEAKRVLKLRTKAEYLEILSIEEDKGWGDKNGTRRTYTVRARLAKIESGIIEDVTATIQKHKGNLPPLGIWQLKTDRMHR